MTDTSYSRAWIIEEARQLDADTLQLEGANYRLPGAFQMVAVADRELAVALRILSGHGVADQEAGSVEYGLHGSRTGPFVLWTDDRGFHYLDSFNTEVDAEAVLNAEEERQNPEGGDDE